MPCSYWSVYGLLTALERPLDRAVQWVPYYHPIKLLFLVWLQHGDYEGARRVYAELLRPLLAAWRPSLDDFLGALLRSLVGGSVRLTGRGWAGGGESSSGERKWVDPLQPTRLGPCR